MKFLMRMSGFSSSIQWEAPFEMHSEEMAKEYVQRSLSVDMAARAGALRVELFNMDTDKHLAAFVFDKPVVREVA